MLLLLALIATAFSTANSNSIIRSKESDEFFDVLDKELEEFLSKAIDDLPRKLADAELQRIEGSGDSDFVTETFKENSESNTVLSSPTFNQTTSQRSREETVLSQMLSSIALTAHMPLNPEVTSSIVKRVVEDGADEELRNLIVNMTMGTPQTTTVSPLTPSLPPFSSSVEEFSATTPTTTTLGIICNTSPVASATIAPSTTTLPTTAPPAPSASTLSSFTTGRTDSNLYTNATSAPVATANSSVAVSVIPSYKNASSSPSTPTSEKAGSATTSAANAAPAMIIPSSKTVREANQTANGCEEEATCYFDAQCGQGRCLGVSLGRCNCHACIANVECTDDSDCGGLRTACRNGICRCAQALATHGYRLYIDALTRFCSQTECTETSDSCFGLPCSRGICSCT